MCLMLRHICHKISLKAKGRDVLNGITVADARRIGGLLSRLSNRQIDDAFRAANYSESEIELLSGALRNRIRQLNTLPRYNREARGRE